MTARGSPQRPADGMGVQPPSLGYISSSGLQPDAQYAARDVHIGSAAGELTPKAVRPSYSRTT